MWLKLKRKHFGLWLSEKTILYICVWIYMYVTHLHFLLLASDLSELRIIYFTLNLTYLHLKFLQSLTIQTQSFYYCLYSSFSVCILIFHVMSNEYLTPKEIHKKEIYLILWISYYIYGYTTTYGQLLIKFLMLMMLKNCCQHPSCGIDMLTAGQCLASFPEVI